MIDAQMLRLTSPAAACLIRFEVWSDPEACLERLAKALGAELPKAGRSVTIGKLRLIWLEPMTWLVRGPQTEATERLGAIDAALGQDGGACDISGALVRVQISGPAWRTLLTIGGVFNAEAATFAPGCMAATVIAHAPVRLDVISKTEIEAYTPPSYAPDLMAFWDKAAARLNLELG